ncbi:RNA polymerase sigma factor [Nakamurella endophytica]|uniref:RNA polymerase subunit sigma-24 n=1 Tax=Nakamurella endophytica TaxID=1748367 RepID=A0A917WAJ8_9ACTN|nr:sigma-70 family RNA polymerase sigma factor [Nakamurella endophytica]GGL88864.1 RNA polymerase subunit sigma-24 [Nakamurella endophytica]
MDREAAAAGAVERVFREDRERLLPILAARFGDLDLAEEVAAEAVETVEAALSRWPRDGVPDAPLAWLVTTARRRAVDRLRRNRSEAQRLAVLLADQGRHRAGGWAGPADDVVGSGDDAVPDERLQLFFTLCHPALPVEAHTALTLRYLAGLTTAEVAQAFLVPVATMAQRLIRAKRKIREARIPFRVPTRAELPDRLPGVLGALYLVFTEGYAASSGSALVRADLVEEAIRLARILHRLLPGEPEVTGLLALLLLTDARRPARTDPDGVPVALAEQDRSRWDRDRIAQGCRLVVEALRGRPGPYGVQAAIAAVHAEAPDAARTDWPQIVALYDVLLGRVPSPVVALNRAVAVGMRDGPRAALDLVDGLAAAPELREFHVVPAVRAELLRRLGRADDAAAEVRRALDLVGNLAERLSLERLLDRVTAGGPG